MDFNLERFFKNNMIFLKLCNQMLFEANCTIA